MSHCPDIHLQQQQQQQKAVCLFLVEIKLVACSAGRWSPLEEVELAPFAAPSHSVSCVNRAKRVVPSLSPLSLSAPAAAGHITAQMASDSARHLTHTLNLQ